MKTIGSIIFFCTILSLPFEVRTQGDPQSERIVTAAQVNGTWCRKPDGELKVWALGKQKLRVEFYGIYQGRTGPNVGGAAEIAKIEGDTAIFKPEEECKITMKFSQWKMEVAQEGTCYFGNSVTASGTYRKISSRKPKFGTLDNRTDPPCRERTN